jgi:2-dehydro-3-deoxyphosphogluconate aldolase/(4S)-4-hydroxy-2-oxoglutarate aldolase
MEREVYIIEEIKKQGVLPLFYHADKDICLNVVKALFDAGIRAVEFTNRGEKAFENFEFLLSQREGHFPSMLIGIGTIRSGEQAARFVNAGADFLVSPVFDQGIFDVSYMSKTLWIPGCMTPTEIHVAENAGCKLVKLFPGNILGPSFASAIRELFPGMLFMPTGGVEVEKENIASWFDAGVSAVGLGSKLISKKDLEKKNYEKIGELAEKALKIVKGIERH